jgi:hypothetical protein
MAEIIDYPWNPDIAIRRMLTSKDVPGAFLSPRTEPDSLDSLKPFRYREACLY